MKYIYNQNTKTLHIGGVCPYTKGITNYKSFNTAEEAHLFAGRQIKPCKTCERKKELMLKENE